MDESFCSAIGADDPSSRDCSCAAVPGCEWHEGPFAGKRRRNEGACVCGYKDASGVVQPGPCPELPAADATNRESPSAQRGCLSRYKRGKSSCTQLDSFPFGPQPNTRGMNVC